MVKTMNVFYSFNREWLFYFQGKGAMYFFIYLFFVAKLYFKNGRKDLKIYNHSDIYKQKL